MSDVLLLVAAIVVFLLCLGVGLVIGLATDGFEFLDKDGEHPSTNPRTWRRPPL